MRIRMKISYHAWLKKISIKQLLYVTMCNTYIDLCSEKNIQILNIDYVNNEFDA